MKLISSKQVYAGRIFRVTEDRAVDEDGFEIRRGIVRHDGSAVMMAVDERRRILLVGRLDPGETPLRAARRELKEETGYRARKWKKLLSYYPTPGYVSEKMTIYLATELVEGEATPMGDERIECRWFTEEELDERIRAGKIADGKTIIGFLTWKRYR